ncbi:hypothetical protein PVAP13_4NG257900 [Panicum virgatum]|uniref:Uncharacterized protein n=1 Tax=Panicum virgatum TaxID=38727 RepID=A0A8T0T743_PANVG|nr:hypothetical protein PVAP13_4NG257900 [Panicum virgatum]
MFLLCSLLSGDYYRERGVRLGGLEEIDRRERAPGAADGMERMPSPPRARSSFCQPLSRPDRADGHAQRGRRDRRRHHHHQYWKRGDREPCHAEMDGTHAARGRLLLQAARTCHLIIF